MSQGETGEVQECGHDYALWETAMTVGDEHRSSEMVDPVEIGGEVPKANLAVGDEPGLKQDEAPPSIPEPPVTESSSVEEPSAPQPPVPQAPIIEQPAEDVAIFDFSPSEVEVLVSQGALQPRPLGGSGLCEKYALLGDKILGLFVTESLLEGEIHNSPSESPEAWIKRTAAVYHSPSVISGLGDIINVHNLLRVILGRDDFTVGNSVKIVMVKAMIGATYRVQGEVRARQCVQSFMKYVNAELIKRQIAATTVPKPDITGANVPKKVETDGRFGIRSKSASSVLKEWFYRRGLQQPSFDSVYVGGPAHRPEFMCTINYMVGEFEDTSQKWVPVGQNAIQGARRTSKKQAIESAAIAVLQELDVSPEIWAEAALLDSQIAETILAPGEEALRAPKRSRNDIQQYVFTEPDV